MSTLHVSPAWDEGYQARLYGQSLRDNPYAASRDTAFDAVDWGMGWECADNAIALHPASPDMARAAL